MKAIYISDKTASFLKEFTERLKKQDNRCTADPFYFTVRKFVDVAVPEGCGDKTMYYDSHDNETYSEKQVKERCLELDMDFHDYVQDRCNSYDVKEEERFENFFFTKEGYDQHVKLNGHNIAKSCISFDSYVDHAYRNPEIDNILKALKEIGESLK